MSNKDTKIIPIFNNETERGRELDQDTLNNNISRQEQKKNENGELSDCYKQLLKICKMFGPLP